MVQHDMEIHISSFSYFFLEVVVYGVLVMCTQFVYEVKNYSISDLYTIILDLFCIWRLYHQIWISGTSKHMIRYRTLQYSDDNMFWWSIFIVG
jgi:hypothetical protein